MRAYGGFCPIAKGAEVFAERWTPLIVRELFTGSTRFSELEMGLPGIPRSLLVKRLRSLEKSGVVVRQVDTKTGRPEYHLTAAGQELFEIVAALGKWGQRWANQDIGPEDVDPTVLMWDMRRRINMDNLPDRRVVLQFDFRGARRQSFWLVLECPEVSVCLADPGFDVDLFITADTVALHRVWMGRMPLARAIREELVEINGPRDLVRAFPSWLALNFFAGVPPAEEATLRRLRRSSLPRGSTARR